MRCLGVAGSYEVNLAYPNRGRQFRYDKPIRELVDVQGGLVIGAAQCLFTGQRIIGLAFPNEQRRDATCDGVAGLSPDISFTGDGERNDPGCEGCPFLRHCVDEARAAGRWN